MMRSDTPRRSWYGWWMCVIALWLVTPLTVAQQTAIPDMTTPVVDATGTLDAATQQLLVRQAVVLQQRKGAQLQVLVVDTTRDEPIERYAGRVMGKWKLGRTGVDDGVLLLVARDDRRVRIETGYGLEGAIPDAVANRIIQEYLVPRFRNGQYADGIVAATSVITGLIEGEPLPAPVSSHGVTSEEQGGDRVLLAVGLGLIAGSVLRAFLAGMPRLLRAALSGLGAVAAALFLLGSGWSLLVAGVVGAVVGLGKLSPLRHASRSGWGSVRSGWGSGRILGNVGDWGGGRSGGGGASGRW